MDEHTPTPWHLRHEGTMMVAIQGTPAEGETYGDMVTISSGGFAQPRRRGASNAAFIVKAVNCHVELIEALESLIYDAELQMNNPSHHQPFSLPKAKDALEKARG